MLRRTAAVAFDLVTVNNRQAACTACKALVDTGSDALASRP